MLRDTGQKYVVIDTFGMEGLSNAILPWEGGSCSDLYWESFSFLNVLCSFRGVDR